VNGLRAVLKKGFSKNFESLNADVFAIQETKIQEHQLADEMTEVDDYQSWFSHSIVKKGYSGVATFSRLPVENIKNGMGVSRFDDEGRILEMDFNDFIFFNIYFPNGQMSDERLQYKLDFYEAFFDYANQFKDKGRGVVITGDFNTAHNEIDLKNPGPNSKRSGFLRIERDWMDRILENGYVDTFRHLYPDTVKYSWWSYRFNARKNNAGWRIDYFFVSSDILDKGWVKDAFIENDILGSDHCPVGLVLEVP